MLNTDLCCLILAGYQSCVAHIKVYFTPLPSSDIFHESFAHHLAPTTLPLLNSPDTNISGPTSVKSYTVYLNWRENCFLVTWLEDSFKGKELWYNVWKIGTCSFSHWQATCTTLQGFSPHLYISYNTGFHRFSHNSELHNVNVHTCHCIMIKSCQQIIIALSARSTLLILNSYRKFIYNGNNI